MHCWFLFVLVPTLETDSVTFHQLYTFKFIVMRSALLGLLVILSLSSCDKTPDFCTHIAIVEDFTELDGWGYLIKLKNGDYLQPIFSSIGWCGTPPLPEGYDNNPLSNFELKAGQRVSVG